MVKKIKFGIEANLYIKQYLTQGKTLSAYILNNQLLENGQVWTYLHSAPADLT